jgi:hypothetical protein
MSRFDPLEKEVEPGERREIPIDDHLRLRWLDPLLPKDFKIISTGNGVRVTVIGRSNTVPGATLSGSERYDIHWAAECDSSTRDGIAAGFGRSSVVGSVDEPGVEGMPAETMITDEKYLTGWYFLTGVNGAGMRSEPSQPRQITNGILDSRVPPPVDHFKVTESGEPHEGTVYSALAVSYRAPSPLNGFARLQLLLENYPNRGELTEWISKRYLGLGGGFASFKALVQTARRPGVGTVTTDGTAVVTFGGGENLPLRCFPGDALEILGVRGIVDTVDSPTQLTLTAPWGGAEVTDFAEYVLIGRVRVYGRSVSAGGGYETDLSRVPWVDVLLDGELSPPNPPILTGQRGGNVIRLSATLPAGTGISHAVLYRGTGTAKLFEECLPIKTWPGDQISANATLQYEDHDFTTFERENLQVFTYFAVAVNVRGQQSDPSVPVEVACQLDSPADGSPTYPGRDQPKNLLWNGMMHSSSYRVVDDTDTDQDTQMGGVAPPAGFFRWDDESTGGNIAHFQNDTEIILPWNAIGQYSGCVQRMDSWNSPNGHVPPGSIITVQFRARTSGGAPNGLLRVDMRQYNSSGTLVGFATVRKRLPDDTIDESATVLSIDPADLESDQRLYVGIFRPRTDLNCHHLRLRIRYEDATGPANVLITRAMASVGEGLPLFTGEIVDPDIIFGPPGGGAPMPPGGFPDGDGSGKGVIDLLP